MVSFDNISAILGPKYQRVSMQNAMVQLAFITEAIRSDDNDRPIDSVSAAPICYEDMNYTVQQISDYSSRLRELYESVSQGGMDRRLAP